jgi:hypothetical protein
MDVLSEIHGVINVVSFCDGLCADTLTVCDGCNVAAASLCATHPGALPFVDWSVITVRLCDDCPTPWSGARRYVAPMTREASPAAGIGGCVVCGHRANSYAIPDVGLVHALSGSETVCGAVAVYAQTDTVVPAGRTLCPDCVSGERQPFTTVHDIGAGTVNAGRDFEFNVRPDAEFGEIESVWVSLGGFAVQLVWDGAARLQVAVTPACDGLTDLAECSAEMPVWAAE